MQQPAMQQQVMQQQMHAAAGDWAAAAAAANADDADGDGARAAAGHADGENAGHGAHAVADDSASLLTGEDRDAGAHRCYACHRWGDFISQVATSLERDVRDAHQHALVRRGKREK